MLKIKSPIEPSIIQTMPVVTRENFKIFERADIQMAKDNQGLSPME